MSGILITITEQAISTGRTIQPGQLQGIYKLYHFYFYSLAVSYRIDKYK
jgi:hypothetical protein